MTALRFLSDLLSVLYQNVISISMPLSGSWCVPALGSSLKHIKLRHFEPLNGLKRPIEVRPIAQGENGRADKLISARCYNYLDLRLSDRNRKDIGRVGSCVPKIKRLGRAQEELHQDLSCSSETMIEPFTLAFLIIFVAMLIRTLTGFGSH